MEKNVLQVSVDGILNLLSYACLVNNEASYE